MPESQNDDIPNGQEMRNIHQLGILAAVSAGPRDELGNYVSLRYSMHSVAAGRAAVALVREGCITREPIPKYSKYRTALTDDGRKKGDKDFGVMSYWLDQLDHLQVPKRFDYLQDYRVSHNIIPSSGELRLLLTLLNLGESRLYELTEQAKITSSVIQSGQRYGTVDVVRREPRLSFASGEQAHVYDLIIPTGRNRALACLALGRKMRDEWQAGAGGGVIR